MTSVKAGDSLTRRRLINPRYPIYHLLEMNLSHTLLSAESAHEPLRHFWY